MDAQRHLVCEPYSVDNLHRMAEELGIGRHWYHASAKYPHYDVPKREWGRYAEDPRVNVVSPRVILEVVRGPRG